MSGRRGVQPPLRCYATSSARQALSNTCTRTWAYAHCSISGKGQLEAVETSRHAVEAGHSTGGERGAASPFGFDAVELLGGRTAAALHVPGPNFDHGGGSVKNARKMPVTALMHTEHGPPVSGFRAGVLCVF